MGLLFDGSGGGRINVAAGQIHSLNFTFGTFACVYNRVSTGAEETLWSNNNGGNSQVFISGTHLLTLNVGGTLRTAASMLPENVTIMSVITKATGTVTPRAHFYRFDTGVWVHENMSGTHANMAALTSMTIGSLGSAGSETYQGEMFCMAFWQGVVMADAETERLTRGRWFETSPDYLRQWFDNRVLVACRALGRKGGRDSTITSPLRGIIVDPPGFRMDRQMRKGR